ncbi:carbon monoxide dehydrogenase subunit G [Krasilnikovia cinnamomea]|uniref:Carbon monoxide dehydrogenase subunit G n=1 Tax=Krasilnikovia cinnamomea TaxID=349313 RepID=A0A4Q7ZUP7_9ACTN|nr:SRPBCC family protein [Krasilnikovia cinnamomea]RZU54363.1 carbon monoxide dehydrogenase subunit G [Krasilnikovia cinnamomea]
MPIDTLRHGFAVAAPPETVHAHLADPHSYVGLSPLVVAVRDVRPVRDAQGRDAVGYVAVERFRLGPLRWDNPIAVTLRTAGSALVSTVVSPGRVRLVATVELAPNGTGTRVTETVEVRCPGVLRAFVLRQARAVQLGRATELARRMAHA